MSKNKKIKKITDEQYLQYIAGLKECGEQKNTAASTEKPDKKIPR